MKPNEYQKLAMRTPGSLNDVKDYEINWGLLQNGVMGLCGELGEVIDLVKKSIFQGHGLDTLKIPEWL